MLNICSVMLNPARKPACSSAMIFSTCGFNLFGIIVSMTLLGWLFEADCSVVLCQIRIGVVKRVGAITRGRAEVTSRGSDNHRQSLESC